MNQLFKTIVIDDEPAARRLMKNLLQEHSDVVEVIGEASNGREAIVLYTPADAGAFIHDLLPDGFKLMAQQGETLGDRLINAAAELLSNGFASV